MTEIELTKLLDERRWAYFIPTDAFVKGRGFRVSIVIEGVSGHFPTGDLESLATKPDHKEPWFWGMTYAEAEQEAAEQNAKLGHDEKAIWQIVASSMFANERKRTKK
jgi:hypothetical protein